MADVQLERGYVRVANRLIEGMLEAPFSPVQLRIVLALVRLTYGWRRRTVRCTDTELARCAGVSPGPNSNRAGGTFRAGLRALLDAGVVIRVDGHRGSRKTTWSIQKDFAAWGRFSIAEARLSANWDERPDSDDGQLRTVLSAMQEARDMADEQSDSEPSADDGTWPESGPREQNVSSGSMAHERATSQRLLIATWPDTGPSRGPTPGHVDSSKSFSGESYDAGKTGKTVITTVSTDLAEEAGGLRVGEPAAAAAGELGRSDAEWTDAGRVEAPGSAVSPDDPEPASAVSAHTAGAPDTHDAKTRYAIGLTTALNNAITRRWGEQPVVLRYPNALNLAEKLLRANVDLEVARRAIAAKVPKVSEIPKGKGVNYFEGCIVDAHVEQQQRGFDQQDAKQGANAAAEKRGGAPTRVDENFRRLTRQELELEHGRLQSAAGLQWANASANREAYLAIAAKARSDYAGFGEAAWVAKARDGAIVTACAAAAGFPDFATWNADRERRAPTAPTASTASTPEVDPK